MTENKSTVLTIYSRSPLKYRYIDDLIAHCDKEFLQGFVRNLALSVQQNLEMPSFRENIVDDENELVALVDFILGGDV